MSDWHRKLNEYLRSPGVVPALSKIAEAMCAPFWWSLKKPGDTQAHILNNGTICYLNTGSSELGITANHVLGKYLQYREEHEDVVECQFGGSTISPEERIIDRSDYWDLATLDVPEVFVSAAHLARRTQHHPTSWPVQRVKVGDVVLYGGYPGILREERGRVVDFPFQWMMGGVCDVSASEERIVIEPELKTITWINPEPGKTFNTDFGGMSGGPIYRVVDGITRLELAGFIYEFTTPGEVVVGRPSGVIAANGSIG